MSDQLDQKEIDAVRDAIERMSYFDTELAAEAAIDTLRELGWSPPPTAIITVRQPLSESDLAELRARFLAAQGGPVRVIHDPHTTRRLRARWWRRGIALRPNPDRRAAWRSFAAGNEHPDR